jgi:hypothetical protein
MKGCADIEKNRGFTGAIVMQDTVKLKKKTVLVVNSRAGTRLLRGYPRPPRRKAAENNELLFSELPIMQGCVGQKRVCFSFVAHTF